MLKPKDSFEVDCYMDADLSGPWTNEDKLDTICVKIRTEYMACLADRLIVWKSRLQEPISMPTYMSEYIFLSTTMKELLFLKEIFDVVRFVVGVRGESNVVSLKKNCLGRQ